MDNENKITAPKSETTTSKTSRRGFLKGCAYGVGGLVVLCSGLGVAATRQPHIDFYESSGNSTSVDGKKVLVAYGSLCGSTGEIAQAIAEEIAAKGYIVDVIPVDRVKTLDGYQSMIIGSAIRMGKLISSTQQFADKFSFELAQIPAAYFVACLTMKEDTEENRATASSYLEPLRQIKLPIGEGLFAGKVDRSKMEYGFQLAFSMDKEGSMADGDYRNWESIRAWGQEIGQKLADK